MALQAAEVSHQRTKYLVAKMAESGHGGLRNALLQNLQKLLACELADVRARDNVWSPFSAPSVQAVASRAIRGKRLLRGRRICIGTRRRGGAISVLTGDSRRANKHHSERQSQDLRKKG